MDKLHFRFSTDILRRLGEELNPGAEQGLIELAKNAYDADAGHCTIEFEGIDRKGGSICIADDGDGMSMESIADGWLMLGRSVKVKSRKRTRLKRIPVGSKGLGRLAALRLATIVDLTTRPRGKPGRAYELQIDWGKFAEVKAVEEVGLEIRSRKRTKDEKTGTDIRLIGLHSPIKRTQVRNLARSLILLADPFSDDPEGFQPELVVPEFEDLERLVRNRYFSDADYHLEASVDLSGRASATVVDWKGDLLFHGKHEDINSKPKKKIYECSDTKFDLWEFNLHRTTFDARTTTVSAVREWLKAFGGVHVYQNNVRVAPYGDPGNDWLDMNLRRVRSPEERPSTNNSIGRIGLYDPHLLYVQKTDRSGFIENDNFLELRRFAHDCLDWMARQRIRVAEERRRRTRLEAERKSTTSRVRVQEAIGKAAPASRKQLTAAFEAYHKSRDREVDRLRKEVQLYRTLSTVGITAAVFAHESEGGATKVITQSLNAISRRGKSKFREGYGKYLEKPVMEIRNAVNSLSVLSQATLSLIDHDKRRLGRVEVHQVILQVLETFRPFLDGRSVVVETRFCSGSPYLRASIAALEAIFTNLLTNSVAAFEAAGTKNRTIDISSDLLDESVEISVEDNGPGIEGISGSDIWLPGQSTRPNGTGLGLVIVRDTVIDLGGTVDAIEHGSKGGAEFRVKLPIIGA